jgi:radical SAM protein
LIRKEPKPWHVSCEDGFSMDFSRRPFTVVWETTRACDLACVHCRAEANEQRSGGELTIAEAQRLFHEIKAFGAPYPILVLTGGDPAKRPDIFDIIACARSEGLRVAMTPSATPLITRDAVKHFAEAGLLRLALSLDGRNATTHDSFRRVPGSFSRTIRILDWCREFGLENQVHTTVTRHVFDDLPAIADLIAERGIKLWALFMLIAVGRAARPEIRRLNISAQQFESLFQWLYDLAQSAPFDLTPREGHHYRRILLQRRAEELGITAEELLVQVEQRRLTPSDLASSSKATRIIRAPLGVNDGKGIVFISHTGDVQPSGFLNLAGGNVRSGSLVDIYRNSPLFLRVRDEALISGKCSVCEFKSVCGGSRARAYAITGDPMRSDPYCIYQPAAWKNRGRATQSKSSAVSQRSALEPDLV